MPFFYSPEIPEQGSFELNKEESVHLSKTLRAKVGDSIKLINGKGIIVNATLKDISNRKVSCEVNSIEKVAPPKRKIHIYLAPPRHNIMSPLVKQCVELGVWSINLIECEFSVSKPKDKKGAFENEIITGAKQSGNPFFPEVHSMVKFSEALKNCSMPKFYGAVPEEAVDTVSISKEGDLSLWIGPEGGFSTDEITALKESGAKGITVGNWILRVETALVSLLGILNS
ncbi:MAG: 16S rRNA (uracil(1498)-N(3))-methyltransferase [Lentisphaeraceae bacterium]|nr:16S rRNA (uracil(1498)-N(3))-methyltransferase [Lentisphaeraceae bacterium]